MNKRQKWVVSLTPVIAILLLLVGNLICNTSPDPGAFLYQRYCESCHFEDGSGLKGVIPPLAGADYLAENQQLIPCIIRFGQNDTIEVNGKVYYQEMPPVELNEGQIMNIMNYINQEWENDIRRVDLREVREWLKDCAEGQER